MKITSNNTKGFTLVEIMIVVVIIGLLAAMAIPAFQKVRTNSQDKAVLNNARQLSAGADQYYLENGVSTVRLTDLHRADVLRQGAQLGRQGSLSRRLLAGHHGHDRQRRRRPYDHVRPVIDIREVFSKFKAARFTWAAFLGPEYPTHERSVPCAGPRGPPSLAVCRWSPSLSAIGGLRRWSPTAMALDRDATRATGASSLPSSSSCGPSGHVPGRPGRGPRRGSGGVSTGPRSPSSARRASVLIVHESFGFKIVMDEVMLAGTSMSMHFNRTVAHAHPRQRRPGGLRDHRGHDGQAAAVLPVPRLDPPRHHGLPARRTPSSSTGS